MIYIANDHGGVKLKQKIIKYLSKLGFKVVNLGTDTFESVNYVDFAKKLCSKVLEEDNNRGILICKSGIGMSIAANRVKGIRAGLCYNNKSSELCRKHNNCNVLVLKAKTLNYKKIVKTFLSTDFEGARHEVRVKSLDE